MQPAAPFDEQHVRWHDYLSWRAPEPLSVAQPSTLHRQLLQLAEFARPRQSDIDQRHAAALRVLTLAQKALGQRASM